jgi:ornithine carbamoyltransferase
MIKDKVHMKRDFTSILDLSKKEIFEILELSRNIKHSHKHRIEHPILRGSTLAMIFEKPSLRTRITFEAGMTQLGGHAVYCAPADIQMGKRETTADVAKNLSRWVDLIMARVFAHKTVKDLAKNATIPVINGLSDLEHPCQIMCDLFTILEHKGSLKNVTIAYVGDGNNVCNSLIAAASTLSLTLKIATPKGYEPKKEYMRNARTTKIYNVPEKAVRHVDIIYTDVWTSMGQESETAQRRKVFTKFQVNKKLVGLARKDALVMHCLPAHRGEEITTDIIDGPRSIVFDQAENRLHTQKAIMIWLLQKS